MKSEILLLWKRNKVDHRLKSVHGGKYDCSSQRAGQTGDKVLRNVGPWVSGNWQRLKMAHRSLAEVLVLIADDNLECNSRRPCPGMATRTFAGSKHRSAGPQYGRQGVKNDPAPTPPLSDLPEHIAIPLGMHLAQAQMLWQLEPSLPHPE